MAMARKRKHTNTQREDYVPAIPESLDAPTSGTRGTKHNLSADSDNSEHRPVKRSKLDTARPDKAIENVPPVISGENTMTTPHGSEDDSFFKSTERLSINKRQRGNDYVEELPAARKRVKLNENLRPGDPPQPRTTSVGVPDSRVNENASVPKSVPTPEDVELPPELLRYADQYDISTMSILSSAKIESRVRNLLERVQRFTFADTKAKPGIVILHAKADVASKMCSIVELAKQQVERANGKWWQYNKLHGELFKLKPKQTERSGGGRTLSEWSKAQAKLRSADSEITDGTKQVQSTKLKGPDLEGEGDDSMDESFETMASAKLRDRKLGELQIGDTANKVRNTPIMTIIFTLVPVPGLKELYG